MRRMILAAACLCLVSAAFADVRVSFVSGEVFVQGEKGWNKVTSGAQIPEKSELQTRKKSRAVLTIDGTTSIWISPASSVKVSSIESGKLLNLIAGRIRAKVKLLSGRKFTVKTPVAVASVRGTDFVCSADGSVAVFEGVVELSDSALRQSILVGRGMISSIAKNSLPTPPRPMTVDERSRITREWQQLEQIAPSGSTSGERPASEPKKDTMIIPEPEQPRIEEASPSIP